jgi:hypothetical protein
MRTKFLAHLILLDLVILRARIFSEEYKL